MERSGYTSELNKNTNRLSPPSKVKELQALKSSIQNVFAVIWLPALLAAVITFVIGMYEIAGRSALAFVAFYGLSYYFGKKLDQGIKKAQEDHSA